MKYFLLTLLCLAQFAYAGTLMTTADGNFTSASTWATVDATSELDSEASSTLLTTSDVDSAATVPGAITVDGVAVKIALVSATPSGTMTVTLRNSTDSVDAATVTINVADIPATDTLSFLGVYNNYVHGWCFFKFGSPVTLTAAKNYVVRAKTSVSSMVTLYRNATAGNWSRMLRTTTTAAPAAGDKLITAGEHTAAGARTSRTVTLDNTASTTFGALATSTFCQSVVICDGGTWIASRAASTALVFKYAGLCLVSEGGILDLGTPASPILASSSVTMQADCTATGDARWVIGAGGIFRSHGTAKQTWAYASADVAAGATTMTITRRNTGIDSGWLVGDEIIIGSSSSYTNYFQQDLKTLTAVAGTNNVNLTWVGGTTYAHPSSSPIYAPVGNLTRNVRFLGESSVMPGCMVMQARSVSSVYYTEFKWMGNGLNGFNANGGEGGINGYASTGGTQVIYGCGVWGVTGYGIYIDMPQVGAPVYQIEENVTYGTSSGTSGIYFGVNQPGGPGTGNGTYLRNNLFVQTGLNTASGVRFESTNESGSYLEITGNTICGSLGNGIKINGPMQALAIDSNIIHSCRMVGIWLNCFTPNQTTFANNRIQRCQIGIIVDKGDWLFTGTSIIGNVYGIGGNGARRLKFTTATIAGESGYASVAGIVAGFPSLTVLASSALISNSGGALEVEFVNSTFGVGTAHTQADIGWFLGTGGVLPTHGDIRVICRNCTLASATEVNINANGEYSWVRSYDHDGVAGAYQFTTNGATDFLPPAPKVSTFVGP